jgi:hypothetical protein
MVATPETLNKFAPGQRKAPRKRGFFVTVYQKRVTLRKGSTQFYDRQKSVAFG